MSFEDPLAVASHPALVVLIAGYLAACVGVDTGAGLVNVDTLADGRVMVVNRASSDGTWPRFAALTEVVRLGSLDGSAADVFGRIGDLALGPAHEVYVLDAQAPEIRVFDSTGVHVRSFGREGQGPGELLRPSGFALDSGGLLWIPNTGNGRYTAFDPSTGEAVHEEARRLGFATFPWPGVIDRQQRMIDVGLDAAGEVAILRLDPSFEPVDTLPAPSLGDEARIDFRRNGVRTMSIPDPFAAAPAWAPRVNGGIVVGEGGRYRLHWIGFGQDTTMTVVLERERVAVTGAERDSALAAFEERAARFAGGAVPDRVARIPGLKPAHGAILVDDADRTWVVSVTSATEATIWDVFAPDGRYLGEVRMPHPSGVRPAVRSGRVAIATELDGVPTVIVYSLDVLER